jgi:succinate dehydrogenase flavin-adding protein (antitoxin of CptAB toxin-antitoxin module)
MLELDLVISKYVKTNIDKWTELQCKDFYSQVLSQETPDLYKLVVSKELQNEENYPFISDLVEFTRKN